MLPTAFPADAKTLLTTVNTDLFLPKTQSFCQSYLDSLVFFGESTTAHLRSREVLSGKKQTDQVWADDSGTRMLSSQGLSTPIVYPETGELLTLAKACEKKRPPYLVLSFGINGILRFAENPELYVNNYQKLIQTVQTASPDTKIILQTVYPVRAANGFSVDTDTLNRYITLLNSQLPKIAAQNENVRIADTASVLKDTDGKLLAAYDAGDGLHLNKQAYEAILHYLGTHAWQESEN